MGKIPFDGNPIGKDGSTSGPSWNDYIIYISCDEYSGTAETGQELSFYNVASSNYKTYSGIPCIDMTSSYAQYVRLTENSINQGTALPRSYSVWLAMTSTNSNYSRGLAIGGYAKYKELCSPNNQGWAAGCGGYNYDMLLGVTISDGVWHHYVQNYFSDGKVEAYLDGVKKFSGSSPEGIDINNYIMSLGCPTNSTSNNYRGYVSTARLWNRTLTDDEILELFQERTPFYAITASDLTFSLYQKNETYGISYNSPMTPVTFEIIEGTLPNTISFNTSTGEFTGKGLTDADHTYSLKVKLTAPSSDPAECNVTIHTYKTARISLTGATWDFITEASSSKSISYTSDEPISEWSIDSGTLPTGVTFSNGVFTSTGAQSSAEQQTVTVRAKSTNNQTGATANYTLKVVLNQLSLSSRTLNFYTDNGESTKALTYATTNPITPTWTITSGALPTGVTFNNGVFVSDGMQNADETQEVVVQVSSSTGCSASASASIIIYVHIGVIQIPTSGLTFYHSLSNSVTTPEIGDEMTVLQNVPTLTTEDGVDCAYFNNNGALRNINSHYFNTTNTEVTLSIWAKFDDFNRSGNIDQDIFAIGKWSYRQAFYITFGSFNDLGNKLGAFVKLNSNYPITAPNMYPFTEGWHHYAITTKVDGNTKLPLYIDGALAGMRDEANIVVNAADVLTIGGGGGNGTTGIQDQPYKGWLASARVYNRVLDENEIDILASEFNPTT